MKTRKKKKGHPGRDEEVALACYKEWLRGKTEVEIGEERGWALQEDYHGTKRFCKTAHRYIKKGEEIYERKRKLAEEAFDLKSKAPIRRKRERERNS